MLTLKDLLDEMEFKRNMADGDLFDTANARMLVADKLALNNIQLECNKDRRLRDWLTKKGRLLVKAEVTTGTVSVIATDKTITFSSAILTADFKGRVFVCDDNSKIEYRIASVTSTTEAELDSGYAGTTNTAATFKILKDRYYLGRNVLGVWNAVDRTNEDPITLENRTGLSDPDIFDVDTGSEPKDGAIILSSETLYNTGTVGVTESSADITHSAAGFIADFDGLAIRIVGDNTDYTFNYTDASNGTLDRVYEGTTAATASFAIAPPGQWQIELYERPTEQILLDFDYLYRLPKLVGNNDISIITVLSDDVLWRGALWLVEDFDNADPQKKQDAYAFYRDAKDKMGDGLGELLPSSGQTQYHDV